MMDRKQSHPRRARVRGASTPRALRWGPALLALLIAALGVATGCGDDDPSGTNEPPPELPGTISTFAGTGQAGYDGDGHTLRESFFYYPIDVTITSSGETYIVDWNNYDIRHLKADGTLETIIGHSFPGDGPSDLSDLPPSEAPGPSVALNHPTHFLQLDDGTFILTSWHNHKLRTYNPATGLVQVLCGRGFGFVGDGGPVGDARLNQPSQCALAPDGSLYVVDQRNERIRHIANGIITTVVGTGTAGFSGDGGPPIAAMISFPAGPGPDPAGALAFDGQGRLYISDTLNNRIRRVDFTANVIETVVGNGTAGSSGDGGPALAASLNNPRDIVFGPDGRLFIADEWNHRVRAVDLTSGTITTVVGNGQAGYAAQDEGRLATDAMLNHPTGLEFDPQGRLYIADQYNHRIRRVILPQEG